MAEVKRRKGKRIDRRYRKSSQSFSEYGHRPSASNNRRQGKEAHTGARERQERVRLRQLVASAMILVCVVAVKLVAPQIIEEHKARLQDLLGNDTDFVAAFSAIGRAVDLEEGLGHALTDAYVAVFGSSEMTEETKDESDNDAVPVYSEDNLPENVHMTQADLCFDYTNPLDASLSDRFGYRQHPIDGDLQFHYGLDLEAPTGSVICSFAEGTVSVVGESSQLGKYVTIVHEGDYTTLYAHCSRITASAGQRVKMGDPIAEVGETGQATGPHLHFELYRDTTYYNPIYYVSV